MSENKKNIKADEGQQVPRAERTRFSSTSLVKIILVVIFSFVFLLWIFQRPLFGVSTYSWDWDAQAAEKGDPSTEPSSKSSNINSPDSECFLPTTRYNIQTGMTACYPSSGGIWVAHLGPVELQHLDINRFDSTERSWDKVEEDRFCYELRKFGGGWYNPKSPFELLVGGECSELDEFEPVFSIDRRVAFPEKGGVWVLGRDEKTGRFPSEMVGVRNSLTMEERSMVLKRLGAVYCDDVTECHLLDDLNKEPRDLVDGQDS